jgi:peptidoglycan/xylan/chitin deacetylase (PgdA/CDA1 family)
MKLIINCEKNIEAIEYGFFSIGDILGLDIEFVDQILDKTPIPVLIYYGRTIPGDIYSMPFDKIFHILPSEDSNIIAPDLFLEDSQITSIPFAFGSGLTSIDPGSVACKSPSSVFAEWVDQRTLRCSIDFPLSVSYILSLEHERDQRSDKLGRPIGSESLIYQKGFSDVPVVDRLASTFWMLCCCAYTRAKALLVRKIPWPNFRKFCMPISHDIDLVQKWTVNAVIKEGVSILTETPKRHLQYTMKTLKSVASSYFDRKTDPYWNFSQIISLEKKYDMSSTFYFLTRRKHHRINNQKIVGNYGRMHEDVGSMMKEIYDSGFEIALHGSIDGFNDGNILEAERNQIESSLNVICNGIRQHFLLFDKDRTPFEQLKAGFQYDSTVGYRDICGYRCGTGFPYSWFNLFVNGKDNFLEIPLVVMDSSLVLEKRGDSNGCRERLFDLLRQGLKQESCITLLWHNTSFSDPSYPWLRQLFEDALQFAHKSEAWVTNLSSLYQWWLQRREIKIDLVQSNEKTYVINVRDVPKTYTFGIEVFVPKGLTYEVSAVNNFTFQETAEENMFENNSVCGGKLHRLYVHPG